MDFICGLFELGERRDSLPPSPTGCAPSAPPNSSDVTSIVNSFERLNCSSPNAPNTSTPPRPSQSMTREPPKSNRHGFEGRHTVQNASGEIFPTHDTTRRRFNIAASCRWIRPPSISRHNPPKRVAKIPRMPKVGREGLFSKKRHVDEPKTSSSSLSLFSDKSLTPPHTPTPIPTTAGRWVYATSHDCSRSAVINDPGSHELRSNLRASVVRGRISCISSNAALSEWGPKKPLLQLLD